MKYMYIYIYIYTHTQICLNHHLNYVTEVMKFYIAFSA